MSNPVWPLSLPQDVLAQGYGETLSDTVLRTENDAGPPKKRRRFTAAIKPLSVSSSMTRAEVATFETFYETTLLGGALNFDWLHPRTQATVTYGFQSPPSIVPEPGAKLWQVRMELEIFP